MNVPELLAPAGNLECAETAFNCGADGVYVGLGKLNLRAHAPNFDLGTFRELLELASTRKKKVYATLNLYPNDSELIQVEDLLKSLQLAKLYPDAFIVSDPGVISLCKKILPNVELHLSTQNGCFNQESMRFWVDIGIKRFVLPREFTTNQIKSFCDSKIAETEIFIHGAMCMSISGRCLMGAYMAERHPNLGDCPQPCRLEYQCAPISTTGSKSDEWFTIEENGKEAFLFNSKDLCTIEILPQLIQTGVTSFKIEGRNKGVHYIHSVVRAYRAAIDNYINSPENFTPDAERLHELESTDHRPFTTGFYDGEKMLQAVFSSKANSSYQVVGIVKGIMPDKRPLMDIKNSFSLDEQFQVVSVDYRIKPREITFTSVTDMSGKELNKIPSNQLVIGNRETHLRIGDVFRRKIGS